MVPIIEEELVRKKKWIDSSEFVDILALSQSAPGILAVNISIVTGYRIRKFTGAVTATLGTVLPSFIIILLIAMFFKQFQDNEVVFKFGKSARITRYNLWIPIAAALLIWLFGFSPIWVVLIAGAGGYLYGNIKRKRGAQ